ncbi:MAG: YggT family protein [Streptococcus parasanguinis]|nr:YggT family protein [Streptococcus parasanguinis]
MIIFQYLSNIIQIYSIILVIFALLSWFPGAPQSTLGSLFRKLPLQFGGLDFTVLVGLLVLNLMNQLLARLFLLLIG